MSYPSSDTLELLDRITDAIGRGLLSLLRTIGDFAETAARSHEGIAMITAFLGGIGFIILLGLFRDRGQKAARLRRESEDTSTDRESAKNRLARRDSLLATRLLIFAGLVILLVFLATFGVSVWYFSDYR